MSDERQVFSHERKVNAVLDTMHPDKTLKEVADFYGCSVAGLGLWKRDQDIREEAEELYRQHQDDIRLAIQSELADTDLTTDELQAQLIKTTQECILLAEHETVVATRLKHLERAANILTKVKRIERDEEKHQAKKDKDAAVEDEDDFSMM